MDDLERHKTQGFAMPKKHIIYRIDTLVRFLKGILSIIALIGPLIDRMVSLFKLALVLAPAHHLVNGPI